MKLPRIVVIFFQNKSPNNCASWNVRCDLCRQYRGFLSKIKGVSEDQVNVGTDPAHIGLDPKIFPSSLPVTEIQKKRIIVLVLPACDVE
jgi:hypothetical protein